MEDQLPDAPYGIVCSIHGKQGLSKENYELQMSLVEQRWFCPVGGIDCQDVNWDDDRYEESEGFIDDYEGEYDYDGSDWGMNGEL